MSFRFTRLALFAGIALSGVPAQSIAASIETEAKQLLLLDHSDGTVLLSRNPHEQVEPASLTKLMTAEILLSELKAGSLDEDTVFTVSEHAWRTGGAPSGSVAMFLKPNEEVAAIDLLRGIVVQSGNDAAIAIAETLEGSEEAFAERMNKRAQELGLQDTNFTNPSGLSAPDQKVSMADLVTLARHIHETYPQYWPIFSEPAFEWNKIFQRNRNPALSPQIGGDGLKTGQNDSLGFGVVATKEQGGRRVFLAMAGLESNQQRFDETAQLLEWALDAFERRQIYTPDEVVADIPVFGGVRETVAVHTREAFTPLMPVDGAGVEAQLVYSGPVSAPVSKGDVLGKVVIAINGQVTVETPLLAMADVPSQDLFTRAADALGELAFGWMRTIDLPWKTSS